MAPIHNAAGSADAVTLRRLLEGGASPDEIDAATGQTPLHILCLVGDRDRDRAACFEILRDAGANLEATFSDRRMTALHCAAYTRSPNLVSLLVEAGVNLNAADSSGWTALHFAAMRDDRSYANCVRSAPGRRRWFGSKDSRWD